MDFVELYQKYITRSGAAELLAFLQETDFYTASASTRFHGSYKGGLAAHSINVWNEMCRLMRVYKDVVTASAETVAVVTLLHDLCKIGCYKIKMRNTKENGVWVQKPFYTFKEDFPFGGHGSKSVYMIQQFMSLSDESATYVVEAHDAKK